MANPRKTVDVTFVLEKANHFLRQPDSESCTPEARRGVASFLETILLETNNYHGFTYLDWQKGGFDAWVAAGKPDFPEKEKFFGDQTKRIYFGAR